MGSEMCIRDSVKSIDVDASDGMPYITMTHSNSVYKFSLEMRVWLKVVDPWYFLALTEAEVYLKSPIFQNLLRKTYTNTQELVERGQQSRYTFDEDNDELKRTMQERFKELVELC